MPAGRPSSITPAVKSKIADCFLVAMTDQQTAQLVGITERTIRRMRAGEFCPEIKKAEMEREFKYRMKLWTSKYLPAGICWMLERKYPAQLAKPEVQLQINTTNQTVNNTLIVTAEVAGANAERVKPIELKIDKLLKDKRPGANGHSHPEAKNGTAK